MLFDDDAHQVGMTVDRADADLAASCMDQHQRGEPAGGNAAAVAKSALVRIGNPEIDALDLLDTHSWWPCPPYRNDLTAWSHTAGVSRWSETPAERVVRCYCGPIAFPE